MALRNFNTSNLKILYDKPPLTIAQQIQNIKEKKYALIENEENAQKILMTNNYYILSGYWHFFNKMSPRDNTFERIHKIYLKDRFFRLLLLEMIEKFEISFKTIFAYNLSNKYKSGFSYLNTELFKNQGYYTKNLKNIFKEMDNAKRQSVFIEHFYKKYVDNDIYKQLNASLMSEKKCELKDLSQCLPPLWMSCEIITLGSISKMYKNLHIKIKKELKIYDYFKINVDVLDSFLEHITTLRNICAHHARIFAFNIPSKVKIDHSLKEFCNNDCQKIYNSLIHMIHIYQQIDKEEGADWCHKLKQHFTQNRDEIYLQGLGFWDQQWESKKIWS